MHGQSIKASAQ